VVGSAAGWVSQLGAIAAGAAAGAALAYAPRLNRNRWQVLGLSAIALVCIGLALLGVVV
jgi:hypothetical protein